MINLKINVAPRPALKYLRYLRMHFTHSPCLFSTVPGLHSHVPIGFPGAKVHVLPTGHSGQAGIIKISHVVKNPDRSFRLGSARS